MKRIEIATLAKGSLAMTFRGFFNNLSGLSQVSHLKILGVWKMGRSTKYRPSPQVDYETSTRESLAPLYWVVMHNDPVTTMEFVVEILITMYGLGQERAVEVMFAIHNHGLERVALMPLERAEFKVQATHKTARARGFPLTCTIEAEPVS